jgi:hypothetical protein
MNSERPNFTQAEELFMRASVVYPASMVTQGAFIALECRALGIDPEELGSSIMKNPEAIKRMCRVAERAHANLPDDRKPQIITKHIESIIHGDFEYAKKLEVLREDEIRHIFDLYFELSEEAETFIREDIMLDKIRELIGDRSTPIL